MNDLNNFMATKLMGWKNAGDWFNEGIDYLMGYGTDSLFTGMKLADWKPDSDLNQALMCADKFGEWAINKDDGYWYAVGRDGVMISGVVDTIEELPKAICEVIMESIENEENK